MQTRQTGIEIRINNKGFTLIEVLIATIILTGIIYLAAISYSVFLDTWGREIAADKGTLDRYRKQALLRASLESIYDYYVTDPADEKKGIYYPFFKGTATSMEFVTLSSVFYGDVPAVARLEVVRGQAEPEAGELCRLTYEEAPLDRNYVKYAGSSIRFKRSMVVYEGYQACRFRYFGEWKTKFIPEKNGFETSYRWQNTFFGKERQTIPEKVEMMLDNGEGKVKLVFFIRTYNLYKRGFFRHVF